MVEKKFSKSWKASIQPRKQRKYAKNAPLHIKHKFVSANLSKELRKENGIRSLPVRKGDTVKIMTGGYKGKTGKITKVSLARTFVHVEGAEQKRADGTKSLYPIHPSNVRIIKLDTTDKKRVSKIEKMKEANK
jgi:large subunit ribosomal protein L24